MVPRSDGWTERRTRIFLRARISDNSAYNMRSRDPKFAAAWEKALDATIPTLEQAAWERAVEGWDEIVWKDGVEVSRRRRLLLHGGELGWASGGGACAFACACGDAADHRVRERMSGFPGEGRGPGFLDPAHLACLRAHAKTGSRPSPGKTRPFAMRQRNPGPRLSPGSGLGEGG
ncbi:hypothetical protein [Sphingomonas sp. KR3-1]|uniref:hypothetical protein n=1 Tax=Sphingomonas sp. KR3-1 TaxID=3156611 RepID=UPI0032B5177B